MTVRHLVAWVVLSVPSLAIVTGCGREGHAAQASNAPLAAPTYSSPWGPQPAAAREQAPAPSGWAAPAPQPAAFPAPAQNGPRPAPAPVRPPVKAPPRASGGGRHRKSHQDTPKRWV